MTDTYVFDSASPRFGLPLLFTGQAQKELHVNEAHSLADALLHCAIEGEASTPPAAPVEGENWLVGTGPGGEWQEHEGAIACRQAGNWLFVFPRDGMRLFDRSSGQFVIYSGTWQAAVEPATPTGGATVDAEARDAITALISALKTSGIFPAG